MCAALVQRLDAQDLAPEHIILFPAVEAIEIG